jgi:hypothetical protein
MAGGSRLCVSGCSFSAGNFAPAGMRVGMIFIHCVEDCIFASRLSMMPFAEYATGKVWLIYQMG